MDAGKISRSSSQRPEAQQPATASAKKIKRAGQTRKARLTPAVRTGAAGTGRTTAPSDEPRKDKLPNAADTEQPAAALQRGGKRKREASAEPTAPRLPASTPSVVADAAEPTRQQARGAPKRRPAVEMKSVKAGGRAQPELSVTEATVHARASQSVSVPETTEPAPGRSSRAAGAKVGGAVKTTAQPKPESKGRTTRRGSAPKPAAPPGDGVERVSPADAAHAQPPTEAAVPAAAASVDAGPPQPEPAARTQESSREPAQKRGRVPSKRIAALQGSPGLDDPPTGLKRPAADALTASVDAAEDGAPALPRGGKSKAKRSKRQQLDDEVVKAKYLADLKQYVEERGESCVFLG